MENQDILINFLEQNDCRSATQWVSQNANKTLYDLYCQCPRGDWLLWFAIHIGIDRRLVVAAACDCAEPVLKFVPDGEDRPRKALETARKWCAGVATIKEVRAAAYAAADDAVAAYAAAAAADDDAAAYAAAAAASVAAASAAAADDAAAAYTAAATASIAAVSAAADSAVYAYAASAASYASAVASSAAYAADAAASVAAASAAAAEVRTASFAHSAKLVRKRIPFRMYKDA